jgi:hypothetical protein
MNVSRGDFKRVVVAVDPATTSGDNADETGIIVVAQGPHIEVEDSERFCRLANCNRHGYVLEDASGRFTPDGWANVVVGLFHKWSADRIVAEGNQGGEMVESVVRSVYPSAPFKRVTARQGKRTRAEPVAALYEQGRVHHCGSFPILEDQLTSWTVDSGESPDRLDALVWGLVEIGLTKYSGGKEWLESLAVECSCGQMNEHGYQRCTKCGELLPVDEPQDEAPDELPIDPVPFSLTSGHDVTGTNYDANKAVMDAIKQYGPKTWSPFGR